MELFDLVNEQDEVIGVTTKERSHKNRDLHRIVAIFVFDKNGELYLQEHLKSGGKYDHSIGGHVRQGESYGEAARREALEELGITDDLKGVTKFYSHDIILGKKSMHVISFYEVSPSDSWVFIPNDEVKHIYPFSLEKIVEMINTSPEKFTRDFIRSMKKYIEFKGLQLEIAY
jgi:isopentenyldiphosphate isomerase